MLDLAAIDGGIVDDAELAVGEAAGHLSAQGPGAQGNPEVGHELVLPLGVQQALIEGIAVQVDEGQFDRFALGRGQVKAVLRQIGETLAVEQAAVRVAMLAGSTQGNQHVRRAQGAVGELAPVGQAAGPEDDLDGAVRSPQQADGHGTGAAGAVEFLDDPGKFGPVALVDQFKPGSPDQVAGEPAGQFAGSPGCEGDQTLGVDFEDEVGRGERESDEAITL